MSLPPFQEPCRPAGCHLAGLLSLWGGPPRGLSLAAKSCEGSCATNPPTATANNMMPSVCVRGLLSLLIIANIIRELLDGVRAKLQTPFRRRQIKRQDMCSVCRRDEYIKIYLLDLGYPRIYTAFKTVILWFHGICYTEGPGHTRTSTAASF